MRRFFETLSVRASLRRWKKTATLDALQATLLRLAVRKALHHWKREQKNRSAFETAVGHYSRNLVSKVRIISRARVCFYHLCNIRRRCDTS